MVMRLLRGRKGVAMEADLTTAGQLGFDLDNASGSRRPVADLIDLVGARGIDVAWVERTGGRSDEDVAVLALCTAEMKMREAPDDAVAGIAKAGTAAVEGPMSGPTSLTRLQGIAEPTKVLKLYSQSTCQW